MDDEELPTDPVARRAALREREIALQKRIARYDGRTSKVRRLFGLDPMLIAPLLSFLTPSARAWDRGAPPRDQGTLGKVEPDAGLDVDRRRARCQGASDSSRVAQAARTAAPVPSRGRRVDARAGGPVEPLARRHLGRRNGDGKDPPDHLAHRLSAQGWQCADACRHPRRASSVWVWSAADLLLTQVALVQWRKEIEKYVEPGVLSVGVYYGIWRDDALTHH